MPPRRPSSAPRRPPCDPACRACRPANRRLSCRPPGLPSPSPCPPPGAAPRKRRRRERRRGEIETSCPFPFQRERGGSLPAFAEVRSDDAHLEQHALLLDSLAQSRQLLRGQVRRTVRHVEQQPFELLEDRGDGGIAAPGRGAAVEPVVG